MTKYISAVKPSLLFSAAFILEGKWGKQGYPSTSIFFDSLHNQLPLHIPFTCDQLNQTSKAKFADFTLMPHSWKQPHADLCSANFITTGMPGAGLHAKLCLPNVQQSQICLSFRYSARTFSSDNITPLQLSLMGMSNTEYISANEGWHLWEADF